MRMLLMLSIATMATARSNGDALAQDRQPPTKPDSSCVTRPDGRIDCRVIRLLGEVDSIVRALRMNDSTLMRRAALGVELRPTGTRRDTLGVFVVAVTPRGPAETAGIIEGDRIATINGVDVRSVAADIDDPYTNGLASHRLSKEVQKLTPGARVTLRVYSGGRFRDVVVTAGRASEVLRHAGGFNFRVPGPGGMEFRMPDGPMMFSPQKSLRFERMGPEMEQRLKSLPRKIELRRWVPGGAGVPGRIT
jgi:hypothetical protein